MPLIRRTASADLWCCGDVTIKVQPKINWFVTEIIGDRKKWQANYKRSESQLYCESIAEVDRTLRKLLTDD